MYDRSPHNAVYKIMTRPDYDSGARRYQAIKEHLFSQLNEEAVILSLKNGKYYGLNSVGVTVWTNVQEAATLAEIEAAVMSEYDVDEETCRREVSAFLEKMVGEELIETLHEPSS